VPPCVIFVLPPHAIWDAKLATRAQLKSTARVLPLHLLLAELKAGLRTIILTNGIHIAQNSPPPEAACKVADGPVVATVRVADVPGFMELGLNEHLGASDGAGVTEHENDTKPLKPATTAMSIVEVADPPAATEAGVNAEAESEKSSSDLNVAVTESMPLMTTSQAPLPEQAPLQPEKLDCWSGAADKLTITPFVRA